LRVQGLGFRAGFGVWGFRFLGFRVGLRVQGLGFRVLGFKVFRV